MLVLNEGEQIVCSYDNIFLGNHEAAFPGLVQGSTRETGKEISLDLPVSTITVTD